ncbi:MAG: hypothetical protein CL447_01955 [Acidimicrobiaceae bacterium]|nr:hypothetical protein [Acidimicrobiaceae bacterium]
MSSRATPWSKLGGVVAAVSLIMSACGGSPSEDTGETSGRGDSAGVSSDRIADLRSSATLAEGAFQGLSTENQVCMLNAISEDDDLGDALIAGDESPPVQLALMRVLLGCDGEAAITLISGGDSGLDDFSEKEFTCLVDSMIANDEVLADAVSGSGALVAQVLLECAPEAAVADLADELGITSEQASCLMTSDNGIVELLISGEPSSEEEAIEFLEAIVEISTECGLEDVFGLSDISSEVESSDDVAVIDQETLDEQYSLCEEGDMQACDDLYFNAPFGSEEEAFAKTCGNTSETEFGGNCANMNTDYRSDCEAGDMEACDQLFFLSDVGSDDEDFGRTCGGTADGTTAGLCSSPDE